MVGAAGFEPTTLSSRTIRATKLRHAPTEVPGLPSPGMIAADRRGRHSRAGGAERARGPETAATAPRIAFSLRYPVRQPGSYVERGARSVFAAGFRAANPRIGVRGL